jgi:hypothetical protein
LGIRCERAIGTTTQLLEATPGLVAPECSGRAGSDKHSSVDHTTQARQDVNVAHDQMRPDCGGHTIESSLWMGELARHGPCVQ